MADTPTMGDSDVQVSRDFVGYTKIVIASAITIAALLWGADLFRRVGLNILTQQFVAGMLGLCLALTFLHFPFRRGSTRNNVPPHDWVLAAIGLAAGLYLAVEIPNLVDLVLMRPRDGVIAGGALLVLSIEALRRSTGWALPIIVVLFLLYGLFGDFVPGMLQGRATDIERLTAYLAIDVNGMLGLPIIVACTVIIAFLLFGSLLSATGGAEFLSDLSLALMGRYRGGPAKIAVLASLLFGSVSGSAVANVVASGVITIPWMKRSGYSPARAAGIEAVASTGGQLMPPVMGASAFLIAEFLQIPFSQVLLAALVPAILYYLALFIIIDLDAGKAGIKAIPASELPRAGAVLKAGWHYFLPFVVMIYALFSLNWQPQMAVVAAIGALLVTALAFGYKGKRPKIADLFASIYRTGLGALDIIVITAGAGMVIGVLSLTGLGFSLTLTLVSVGEGNLFLLLLISAVVCIILGMGLPTVGVYVLLAALVAPAIVELGVLPISAHLYVMYFGLLSFLTPPVAVAAYAAATIAKADPLSTALHSMRLGWTAYIVPFLFVSSPALVMQGAPLEIVLATSTAVFGVFLCSVGMVGFMVRPLGPLHRLVFFVTGILALVPYNAFAGADYTDVIGVLLGVVLLGWEFWHRYSAARRIALADALAQSPE
ncbi:TRAP transporter permease [Pararhodobacter zhoushanensis]|uniref:TRAP transporter permease n=1 Tax=Pararhodobacter zhoushanensis TaxID=2479545 RepID=UPI000F8F5E42|nr:TRAP transporter fused permease subunit [Pararhodobacter zhoushanensis]